jgi:uncharacterized membrane protein
MLITSDDAFGFGQQVTGGKPLTGATKNLVEVNDKTQLKTALGNLTAASTAETVITIAANDYEFKEETQNKFTIGAKNVTIRAKKDNRVELKNIGLVLDLASIDNILIKDLAFHSDGSSGSNDAILFDGTAATSGVTNRVRITHCTFDGYKDMAIEIRSALSRLLATIDHCHFVDRNPGGGDFLNRGSINIASVIASGGQRLDGNSFVTVAFNFIEDVWRRSPRVAAKGSQAHIFNNVLSRPGFGNTESLKWNGIVIENKATAAIQANRIIPWSEKASGVAVRARTLKHDDNTTVDVGDIGSPDLGQADLRNELDNAKGKPDNYFTSPIRPEGSFATLLVSLWYTGLGLVSPPVTPAGRVPWADVIARAGTLVRDPLHP